MLKISKANLYRLMSTGIIKYVKLGGRTLFKKSELSEFIDSLGAKEKVNHRKTGTKSNNVTSMPTGMISLLFYGNGRTDKKKDLL